MYVNRSRIEIACSCIQNKEKWIEKLESRGVFFRLIDKWIDRLIDRTRTNDCVTKHLMKIVYVLLTQLIQFVAYFWSVQFNGRITIFSAKSNFYQSLSYGDFQFLSKASEREIRNSNVIHQY